MAFDLTLNPFALLHVSPRATKSELADAYQSAVLDGLIAEAILDRAFATLISAKDRLRAEVGFFTAATPAEIRKILTLIQSGVAVSAHGKAPLDRANLIGQDLSGDPSLALLEALVAELAAVDPAAVCHDINSARQVAQVGQVQKDDVADAVTALIAEHASNAAEMLLRLQGHGKIAEALIRAGLEDEARREFLSHFVDAYSKFTTNDLARLRRAIEAEETTLRADPNMLHAKAVLDLLYRWDNLRQPVQIWDEAHGIDEPVSKDLGTRLRDLCLWLANERGEYEIALTISSGLQEAFGELAGMRDQFGKDIATLEELAEEARIRNAMEPLVAVLTEMRAKPTWTASNLGQWLGSEGSPDRGKLGAAFEAVNSQLDENGSTVPALAIRNLSLDFHNEFDRSAAALRMTDWLLEYRATLADDIVQRLLEDRETLMRISLQADLKVALERRRYAEAERLLTSLLAITRDPEERATLRDIVHTIDERRSKQLTSRIGWGVTAAIAVVWIIAQIGSSGTDQPGNTDATTEVAGSNTDVNAYQGGPGVSDLAPPAMAEPVGNLDPAAVADDDTTEAVPDVGEGNELTRQQLRYCLRQKERLTLVQAKLDTDMPGQVSGFNSTVDDYNSRCSNFRYLERDMTIVQSQIASESAMLAQDADRMAGGW